jgi:hypothetical protein
MINTTFTHKPIPLKINTKPSEVNRMIGDSLGMIVLPGGGFARNNAAQPEGNDLINN